MASATLPIYSHAFHQELAGELEKAPPLCDRQEPMPGCSALARAAVDYAWVRRQQNCFMGTIPEALCKTSATPPK